MNHRGDRAPASTAPSLLAAMAQEEDLATAGWQAWRAAVDIQHLTWPEMQILPLLNGPRLESWLADDPSGGVLLGIVRRAWSETQVRLSLSAEVARRLQQSGCESVTQMSAVGVYLRNLQTTAIRPILELRMLIPRRNLVQAAAALKAEGWQLRGELPSGHVLDELTYIFFSRNGARLHLHWRVLRVEVRDAAACESEFLAHHQIVEAIGSSFRILTPGHALLESLVDPEETVDVLAWQADATLLCLEKQDWRRWAELATRYQPQAFERIAELRAMGLHIPASVQPVPKRTAWVEYLPGWLSNMQVWRRFAAVVGK